MTLLILSYANNDGSGEIVVKFRQTITMSARVKKAIPGGDSMTTLPSQNQVNSSRPASSIRQPLAVKKPDIPNAANSLDIAVESYFKKIDSLPIAFSILKEGLSEIGDSPDKLRPAYRKLSVPVREIEFILF